MLKRLNRNFTIWLFVGDMSLTLAALAFARSLRLLLPLGMQVDPQTLLPLSFTLNPEFYGIVLLVWAAVFMVLPVYDSKRSLHTIDNVQVVVTAIAFAVLILAGIAYFFYRELSRVLFVYFAVLDLTFLIAWRGVFRTIIRVRYSRQPAHRRRVVIVGSGLVAEELASRIGAYSWTGLELAGFIVESPSSEVSEIAGYPVLGSLTEVRRIVVETGINEVLMALPLHAYQELVDMVLDLQSHPVSVRVVPDLFDLAIARTQIEDLDGIPVVSLRDPVFTPTQRLVKRAFDLFMSSLLLIVLALPMLIVAVAIKLDAPGTVIFRQRRVGEQGRLFWMLKFRSMVNQADESLIQTVEAWPEDRVDFKRPNDPRVTRVGHWLRQFSLDELPQLFNVLKGEMSLVGPRPELPWIVDRYTDWQRKRFAVPQGMTGWWQVNGRSDKPIQAKVRDDLYYIQNYSILLDLLIIWKTVGAVVRRKGAF